MKCLGIERTRSKKKKKKTNNTVIRFGYATCISLRLKTMTVQRANRVVSFFIFSNTRNMVIFPWRPLPVQLCPNISFNTTSLYVRRLLPKFTWPPFRPFTRLCSCLAIEITEFTNNNNKKKNLYQISVPATCMSLRKTQNHCATRNVSSEFRDLFQTYGSKFYFVLA
jgi:hypothetical protein